VPVLVGLGEPETLAAAGHRVSACEGGRDEMISRVLEVSGLAADFVEHASEELGVLRFVSEEGGQEQLLLEALFAYHGHDERQQVTGHTLFRGLEQHREAQQHITLGDAEASPLVHVAP